MTDPLDPLVPAPPYRRLAVPATVIAVCATSVLLGLVGSFSVLAFYGRDSTPLVQLVNTIMNVLNLVLSGGAIVYAGSADRKAGVAVQQTNHSLDARLAATVQTVIRQEHSDQATADREAGAGA